jgi:hypothetical protein
MSLNSAALANALPHSVLAVFTAAWHDSYGLPLAEFLS